MKQVKKKTNKQTKTKTKTKQTNKQTNKKNQQQQQTIFHEWPQISHTHKNRNFKSIIGNWQSNCFYIPYQSYGRDMSGTYTFSLLAVVNPKDTQGCMFVIGLILLKLKTIEGFVFDLLSCNLLVFALKRPILFPLVSVGLSCSPKQLLHTVSSLQKRCFINYLK